MVKHITLNGNEIEYSFEYKKVKNINLRIKQDGSIFISANRFIPHKAIEEFILKKADFILSCLDECEKNRKIQKICFFTEESLKEFILSFCEEIYPYYKERGIKFPQIKFRKMVSRWGSCHINKGLLTFNTNLIYVPEKCVQYVCYHEFTHFIHPDHSKHFYNELQCVFPEWKECKKILKSIVLEK